MGGTTPCLVVMQNRSQMSLQVNFNQDISQTNIAITDHIPIISQKQQSLSVYPAFIAVGHDYCRFQQATSLVNVQDIPIVLQQKVVFSCRSQFQITVFINIEDKSVVFQQAVTMLYFMSTHTQVNLKNSAKLHVIIFHLSILSFLNFITN